MSTPPSTPPRRTPRQDSLPLTNLSPRAHSIRRFAPTSPSSTPLPDSPYHGSPPPPPPRFHLPSTLEARPVVLPTVEYRHQLPPPDSVFSDEKAFEKPRPAPLALASDDPAAVANTLAVPFSPTSLSQKNHHDDEEAGGGGQSRTTPPRKKPPSFTLLFSLTDRSTFLSIVLPAIVFSTIAAAIPPYMTELLGVTFGLFSDFSLAAAALPPTATSTSDLAALRSKLLKDVGLAAVQFLGLAAAVMVVVSVAASLWSLTAERTSREMRRLVFRAVGKKDMAWFDLGMGRNDDGDEDDGQGADGVGGLVGRFSKDIDDIRLAIGGAVGFSLQYLLSFLACLGMSFWRSYILTFVILASVPVSTILISVTERIAHKYGVLDRDLSARQSSLLDVFFSSLTTLKSFNATKTSLASFVTLVEAQRRAYNSQHFVWGIRTGATQFIMLSMFVQGFWFGAYLVRTGKASAASVNTCFWACLLATSFLQSVVPLLVVIEKGKIAMAGLLALTSDDGDSASSPSSSYPTPQMAAAPPGSPSTFKKRRNPSPPYTSSLSSPHSPPTFIPLTLQARSLRKLRPTTFSGEMSLASVTFAYPSRPTIPVLKNVSMYFAARETTYVVGTSGSGKSTISSLLLALYEPEAGRVEVDEQPAEFIDKEWVRGHVACVAQGQSALFDGSIHDNVAIGVAGQLRADGSKRNPKDVTREEVVQACRSALVHEFVRDLPEGYDTWLSGERGASLSGGQRQRLALARAWIRDPTVLILDEATSALDATSRVLVAEALKRWRQNKTTVIITHDLTPIGQNDFVYMMAEGRVVQEGYRKDLEKNMGPFWDMLHAHNEPEVLDDDWDRRSRAPSPSRLSYSNSPKLEASKRFSYSGTPGLGARQLSYGEGSPSKRNSQAGTPRQGDRSSVYSFSGSPYLSASGGGNPNRLSSTGLPMARRLSFTNDNGRSDHLVVDSSPGRTTNRLSYQASSDDPGMRVNVFGLMQPQNLALSAQELKKAKRASAVLAEELELGTYATPRRSFATPDLSRQPSYSSFEQHPAGVIGSKRNSHVGGGATMSKQTSTKEGVVGEVIIDVHDPDASSTRYMSFTQLMRTIYPTIPNKPLLFLGLFLALASGACTPVFSSLLSQLMANIGDPNSSSLVLRMSLFILLVAFIEGAAMFGKFVALERCAMGWCCAIRTRALQLVLQQDKGWFDRSENSTTSLAYSIVKDSEDARLIVGTIIGNMVMVVAMLFISLAWSFAVGWELTLVGLGLAPIFIVATRLQTSLQARYEARNKVLREGLSIKFHETVANVRAIRSMAIEATFEAKFEASVQETYVGARRAAPFAGLGLATSGALTYVAEALMFYIGAILIAHGRYTFGKVVQVFTMIIFAVTFAGQIMNYLPMMTKSFRAAIDLWRLLELTSDTREAEGTETFPVQGRISFDNVFFSYPERSDVPVLRGLTFDVRPGECVGIVGASGSGKSTITSLLQRFYEPDRGAVILDGHLLNNVDTEFLRDHTAIVSQHPALFDMTVSDNIAYGLKSYAQDEVIRAAKAAQVHDFIVSLPKGYDTLLGENASLISGGQAQRLQIARALIRSREILILDECTSALDPTNQMAVMETIGRVKQGKTTLIVTHKLAVMETCDRLLVVVDGAIVEQGTVAALKALGGVFSKLASSGEWEAS